MMLQCVQRKYEIFETVSISYLTLLMEVDWMRPRSYGAIVIIIIILILLLLYIIIIIIIANILYFAWHLQGVA